MGCVKNKMVANINTFHNLPETGKGICPIKC